MPAPVAMVWSGFARVLAEGGEALPRHAGTGALIGAGIGIVLALLDRMSLRRVTPSAIGLGVAMVIPALYCFPIFLGSMAKVLYRAVARESHDQYCIPLASGGIVGEGLAGILVAALKLAGVLH